MNSSPRVKQEPSVSRVFDAFVDMDLCVDDVVDDSALSTTSNAIDPSLLTVETDYNVPRLDFSNMSAPDLFKYFFNGELNAQQPDESNGIARPVNSPHPLVDKNNAVNHAVGSSKSDSQSADLSTLDFAYSNSLAPPSSCASPLSSVELQFEEDSSDHASILSAKIFDSPLDTIVAASSPTTKTALSSSIKSITSLSTAQEDKGKNTTPAEMSTDSILQGSSMKVIDSLPADVRDLLDKIAHTMAQPLPFGNDTTIPPKGLDDRPSPTEMKKLTSKERRQLRNKISARNFRVRRKEYITSLESHISEQQMQMQLLRSALFRIQEDNINLRNQVESLKTGGDAIASTTALEVTNRPFVAVSSPAVKRTAQISPFSTGDPKSPVISTSSSSTIPTSVGIVAKKSSPSKDLPLPNLDKDRSVSGATLGWRLDGPSPFMSVHTTLVPNIKLSEKDFFERPLSITSSKEASMVAITHSLNPLANLSMASELGFSSDKMAWLAYSTMAWFASLYQGFVDDDDSDEILYVIGCEHQRLLHDEFEQKRQACLLEMVS